MGEFTTVAVDAMGGDDAPGVIIKGAVDAVTEKSQLKLVLVGDRETIEKELSVILMIKIEWISDMQVR